MQPLKYQTAKGHTIKSRLDGVGNWFGDRAKVASRLEKGWRGEEGLAFGGERVRYREQFTTYSGP
jgi:hypothetical protein